MPVREQALLEFLAETDPAAREIKDLQDKFVKAADRMEAAAKEIDFDPASKEARELRAEVEKTAKEFTEAGDRQSKAMQTVAKATDRVEKELEQTRVAAKRFADTGSKSADAFRTRLAALRSQVAGLGGLFGGLSIAFLGQAAFRQLKEFQSSMSAVQAVTGATGEEFARLERQAKTLGATTVFSASEAARGMEFLGRAGFDAGEILRAMPGLLDLAAAGNLDLARAADIASNVVSGFNLQASETARVADVLAKSAASSNTSVEQLGLAMSYVAPVAAGLNITLEEAAAAIGVLSNAGIQASRAGTGLAQVLAQLTGAIGESGNVFEELGLDLARLNPETNSLAEILEYLGTAGLSATRALEAMKQRGGPALQVLVDQREEVARLVGVLENAAGAAEEMSRVMRDNLSGDVKELTSRLEALTLQAGDRGAAGALRDLVQGLTDIVSKSGRVVDIIKGIGDIVAASLNTILASFQRTAAIVSREILELFSLIPGFGKVYQPLIDKQNEVIRQMNELDRVAREQLAEAWRLFGSEADEAASEAAASVARMGRSFRESLSEVGDLSKASAAELEVLGDQAEDILGALQVVPEELRGQFEGLTAAAESFLVKLREINEEGGADAAQKNLAGAIADLIGDPKALTIETDEAVAAIRQILSEGNLTGAKVDALRGKVGDLLSEWELLGERPPRILQELAERLGVTATATESATKATSGLAKATSEAASATASLTEAEAQRAKQLSSVESAAASAEARLEELRGKDLLSVDERGELEQLEDRLSSLRGEQNDLLSEQADLYEVIGNSEALLGESIRKTIEASRGPTESFLGGLDPDEVDALNESVAQSEGGFEGLGKETGLATDQLIEFSKEGAEPTAEAAEKASAALAENQKEFNAVGAAAADAGAKAGSVASQFDQTTEAFSGLAEGVSVAEAGFIRWSKDGAEPATEAATDAVAALQQGQDAFNQIGEGATKAGEQVAEGADEIEGASERIETATKDRTDLLKEELELLKAIRAEVQGLKGDHDAVLEVCRAYHACVARGA